MSADTRSPDGSEYAQPGQLPHLPKATRVQARLGIAVVLCYLVGYPVALAADAPIGWVLVSLGGVFLLLLGIVTVRRMHGTPPS